MAIQITNETQLSNIFIPKLKEAVDYVVQKIWNENRSLIEQLVYEVQGQGYYGRANAYTENPNIDKQYERTGQFKEAWDTSVKSVGSYIEGEFKYNPRIMEANPDLGQHASVITGIPSAEDLAHIIYDGVAGHIFGVGYWTQKRDAWSALDKWLSNKQFRKIFEEGMTLAGIPWKRNIGKVQVEKWEEVRWRN